MPYKNCNFQKQQGMFFNGMNAWIASQHQWCFLPLCFDCCVLSLLKLANKSHMKHRKVPKSSLVFSSNRKELNFPHFDTEVQAGIPLAYTNSPKRKTVEKQPSIPLQLVKVPHLYSRDDRSCIIAHTGTICTLYGLDHQMMGAKFFWGGSHWTKFPHPTRYHFHPLPPTCHQKIASWNP